MNCGACGARIESDDGSCGACGAPDARRRSLHVDGQFAEPDDFEIDPEPLELDSHDEPLGSPREGLAAAAAVKLPPRPDAPRRAHFVPRALALVIDLAILSLVAGMTVLLAFAAIAAGESLTGTRITDGGTLAFEFAEAGSVGIVIAYFALLNSGTGQTLGKAAVSIRVQGLDGEPVGPGRGIVRVLGTLVSGLGLGLGFLWALGPARRAWHDYLAGTVVVRA